MFGFGKSKPLIGMDIGSSSVKVVELKQTGKEIEIEAGTGPVSGMIFCWDCGANAPPLIVLQAELLAG